LEVELTLPERAWYIRAVRQFGWSKRELQHRIKTNAHLEMTLDFEANVCYTEEKNGDMECTVHDENPLCVSREYRDRISESIDTIGFLNCDFGFDTQLTHNRCI